MKNDESAENVPFFIALYAFIFCSAVSLFVIFLTFSNSFHKNTITNVRNNQTIFVNDTEHEAPVLDVSEVINEIMTLDDDVLVYIDGSELSSYVRDKAKGNITVYNLYLPSMGSYEKNCNYSTSGKLMSIEYKTRSD